MDNLLLSEEELESLSPEELRELYRSLEKHEEAVSHSKGDIYLENATPSQLDFHKAKPRVRMFFGGNRSGKSTAGTNEARWLATGTHPYRSFRAPSKGCIILQDFQTHARDIILPKIKEWFHPGDIVRTEQNQSKVDVKFYLKNGSIIDVKSHDQDIKVFEGGDYDWAWFDEPPPEAIFVAVWRGLTDRKGIAFITGTPIVQPWMFDMYKKAQAQDNKGLYWFVFSDSEENAVNLGEGDREEGLQRIEEFLEAVPDPEERIARKKGTFLHMSGIIFKNWNRGMHLISPFEWPHTWPVRVSLDPHPRKPWAYSFIGETPSGNQILLRSGKIDDVVSGVARDILWEKDQIDLTVPGPPKIIESWIDNYSSVESMIKSSGGKKVTIVDELNHLVTPTIPRFRPAPKNVDEKIGIFKEWLMPQDSRYGKRPRFLVFDIPENLEFITEIEHYVWASGRGINRKKLKNVPVKENDDILDTVMQVALVLGSEKGQHGRNARPEVHSYIKRRR